jgi:hypothetical protein
LPSGVSTCEIDASTGNSSPLDRKPYTTVLPLIRREVTPVAPKRATCAACLDRNRSGNSMDKGRPSASEAGQPKILSAARL